MTELLLCQICTGEIPDTCYVCPSCGARLRGLLLGILDDVTAAPTIKVRTSRRDVLGAPVVVERRAADGGVVVPGLASALEAAIRGELRFGASGPSSRPTWAPLPLNADAVFVRDTLLAALREQADAIARVRGLFRPLDTLPALATWLAHQVDWLRQRDDGGARIEALTQAIVVAKRTVDHRVDDRHYRGVCVGTLTDDSGESTACGARLYVKPGSTVIECARCGATYDEDGRRLELLAAARVQLVTGTEAARALRGLGVDLKPSTVRSWVHRGRLTPATVRGGRPLYRLGTVLELARREGEARARRQQLVAQVEGSRV